MADDRNFDIIRQHAERRGEDWGTFKEQHDDMRRRLGMIEKKLDGLRESFDKIYAPIIVKTIVFGGCAMILSAVMVGIIALVVKQK